MITRLRRNFILVAMCSTFAVLAVIVGTLNLVSYQNVKERADNVLQILVENDGGFPQPNFKNHADAESQEDGSFIKSDKMMGMKGVSEETPYETRFFSVKLDENGEVLSVDTGKIAAVQTSDAASFAEKIWESGKVSGFYRSYRYRMVSEANENLIVFVDTSKELSGFRTLAVTSVSVSAAGLLAVFLLVLFFSKMVFRPVAAGYEKQKQFITDASHELKTPLTIISANVEVLEMESGESSWTKSIHNQITRLTALVEQMVKLSRMDEDNKLQSPVNFSLSDAVRETAELFLPTVKNAEKTLEIETGSDYIYLGDEKLIRQMVSLLVDNAVKYSSEKGQIRVNLQQKGRHFQLSVWNTVESMKEGNLDILFERFYRLDASRNSGTGGSGIGLSIVKAIAEAHKGKVSAVSADGKSFEIKVLL